MESAPRQLMEFIGDTPGFGPAQGEPIPLAGDVSSRRYFRGAPGTILTLYPAPFPGNWELPSSASATRGYFNAVVAADPQLPLRWANDPIAQVESTTTLELAGIPVPQLLALDGERGVVAVVDVGDLTLQVRMENAGPQAWSRWYREAVDLICRLQGAGTQIAQARGSIPSLLALDGPKLAWEMAYFDRTLLVGLVSESHRRGGGRDLERLCEWLGAQPQVLCHRDYHCRNLMISSAALGPDHPEPAEERLVVIDHQDARMGPRAYDMVSLLDDPYLQPDPALVEDLWAYFNSLNAGPEGDWEGEILATRAQRLIKAAGTYGAQVRKGRGEFKAYLVPTLNKALSSLEALGSYPRAVDCLRAALASL